MLLKPLDWARPNLLHQAVDDLDAGQIALVHRAIERLAGEGLAMQRAVGVAIEEAADLVLQFVDTLDRLGHERPGKGLVWQPLAALDRVHEVPLDRIPRIEGDVLAALHHARESGVAEKSLPS